MFFRFGTTEHALIGKTNEKTKYGLHKKVILLKKYVKVFQIIKWKMFRHILLLFECTCLKLSPFLGLIVSSIIRLISYTVIDTTKRSHPHPLLHLNLVVGTSRCKQHLLVYPTLLQNYVRN